MNGVERVSLDSGSLITSTFEVEAGPHVHMNVRMRGITIGTMIVDKADAGQFRDLLMPAGHEVR